MRNDDPVMERRPATRACATATRSRVRTTRDEAGAPDDR
ncbi:MAG: hypothetical protein AVDCRST_MAG33-1801 [uncultured Thermomicrobiales bacterium]|uniref:Uncharacterized protein n=1 Tax=uncultured Thermomicrobiales bacterium TaxID=1645740 RepID=A0A6J4UZF8_9BACT|nr:MAG: hypothetical protein AVDCRST_MAG33-1801 [uncultured Thermomicrobiales bacterium]